MKYNRIEYVVLDIRPKNFKKKSKMVTYLKHKLAKPFHCIGGYVKVTYKQKVAVKVIHVTLPIYDKLWDTLSDEAREELRKEMLRIFEGTEKDDEE